MLALYTLRHFIIQSEMPLNRLPQQTRGRVFSISVILISQFFLLTDHVGLTVESDELIFWAEQTESKLFLANRNALRQTF